MKAQPELPLTIPGGLEVVEVASADFERTVREVEARGGWVVAFAPVALGSRWKLTVYPAERLGLTKQ